MYLFARVQHGELYVKHVEIRLVIRKGFGVAHGVILDPLLLTVRVLGFSWPGLVFRVFSAWALGLFLRLF